MLVASRDASAFVFVPRVSVVEVTRWDVRVVTTGGIIQYMGKSPFRVLAGVCLVASLALSANVAAAQSFTTRGTPVTRVLSLVVLNIRSGPHTSYPVVGRLYPGQRATVIGISSDYNWWRISCRLRSCWVSANPAYSRPIAWR